MTKRKMIYLACPYSPIRWGKSKWGKWFAFIVRQVRYRLVNRLAAKLMVKYGNEYTIFSPISHSHPVSLHQPSSWHTHDNWLGQDEWFVDKCDELWVYTMFGWKKSFGVNWEIARAKANGTKIVYVDNRGEPNALYQGE